MLLLMLRPDKDSPALKLLPLAKKSPWDRAIEMSFERLSRNECGRLPNMLLSVIIYQKAYGGNRSSFRWKSAIFAEMIRR